jgi:thiamine-monophosphate kinase
MSLGDLGERGLIDRIRDLVGPPGPRTLIGIGDDAAEWVHFRFDFISPDQLGEKVVAATVSDCAAMGCAPLWVTVALAAPEEMTAERIEELYVGLRRGAGKYGCDLVGGDTIAAMSDLTLSLTAVGEPFGGRVLTRSGAEVGDDVFVTGRLGGATAGLLLLENAPELTIREEFRASVLRYLSPEARVAPARVLASRFPVSSLIDVSDGLSVDLHHLAREGRVGFRIERALVPAEASALRVAHQFEISSDAFVLHGGEEFELLFTAPPGEEEAIVETVREATGVLVTRIGSVVDEEEGVLLVDENGEEENLPERGFEHFRSQGALGEGVPPEDPETESGTRH